MRKTKNCLDRYGKLNNGWVIYRRDEIEAIRHGAGKRNSDNKEDK